ncbi:MAG: DUF3592 domain-containing protein [Anaerolineae bacterium]|nr:DUF3592 domain-containing protein [Anaerolineae bacterium]
MPVLSTNIIIPLILIIIGLVMLFIYFRSLLQARASEGWPTAQGTVLESWVRRSSSTDSDGGTSHRYYPEVRYQYQVMGREFQGDRMAFGPRQRGNRSAAEKVVAGYPAGESVTVYYQPDQPASAILERSVPKMPLFSGILLILMGIFIYIRWG